MRCPHGQYTKELFKLIPSMRIAIRPRTLLLTNTEGEVGRLRHMSKLVTKLIRQERLEFTFTTLSEVRNYTERLIAEAIRHGDCHQPTMELATYWVKEPELVHKLFKVLVPRYRESTVSYTKMYKAPTPYPGDAYPTGVLELRNNPLPPVAPRPIPTRNWIHNILLEEVRKEMAAERKLQRTQSEMNEEVD